MPVDRDVSAPGGPPRRECGACGAGGRTWAETCPECGEPYHRPRLSRRDRRSLAALVLVAVAAAAVYAAPRIDASRDRQAVAAASRAAALEAAERARVARDQVPVRGRLAAHPDAPARPARERVALRRRIVVALEEAVRSDAQRRFEAGVGDGPVVDGSCRPLVHTHGGRGDEVDPHRPVGRYECLAATGEVRARGGRVARVGQPYVAAVEFRTGAYVLCKHHPPPGEGGVMLAQVPLDPSCFGARDERELAALRIRETPRD